MSPSVSVRLLLTQSDARLLAFARAGHERAFEALVQRYRRQLLGYCRRLLLSDERAEDALQQALLQAWLALREGTEVGEVRPWLYRIVHNAALNTLRVSGYDYCKLSESLSGADAPQADLDRRIAVREALAGLATLPEMQREALLRTAVEGRSHQQVARDLGLSENALRGLVYRARAALRAAAGAVTPPPLVSWALGSGARGTPIVERLSELGVGSGSAGIAGLLMKGGAVAVTASVVAGGVVAVHAHRRAATWYSTPHRARLVSSEATPIAVTATQPASWAPAGHTQPASRQGKRLSARGPTPRPMHVTPWPSSVPRRTSVTSPLPPVAPNTHRLDGRQGRPGGGDHNEMQGSSSSGPVGDEATPDTSSAADHGAGREAQGANGVDEESGGHNSEGGHPPGDSISPSPSGGGGDGDFSAGVPGDGAPNTGQPVESYDRQSTSGATSSTRTNGSSKDERIPTSQSATGQGVTGD